ncbi:hypothetical protein [Bacillus atrophaeus]|uniref:hypothetical protein n=1 Tax=Bacillus atrophaeus TaxID=1452 RepID=UPI001C636ACE|nr:hypothetical protein [Bacillus atrophaeus]MCY9107257.1 hypothetical protein [Bacillus atrophaeus]MED4805612.1 hypothetical protein [Bacillus atrophaeus]MED4817766.1 hypothetical protein [Bacillus atrophaeus]MED4825932.1 hypothetical protein [Bacillus atrophaeus]MED4844202.1 hypothetical protein [Bacillus atrophaeus]
MDLNGLISTITTSTAALVAIIGGFLVSRVISLSSEQTGIKRRIREIDNDLLAKKELLQNIENYLLEEDAKDFLKDNIKKLLQMESLSEIINEDKYNYRSEEELKPYFNEMQNIMQELFTLFDKLEELDDDFDDFYKKNSHHLKDIEKRDLYEIAYDGMMDWVSSQSQSSDPFALALNYRPPISNLPSVNLEYRDKKREHDRLYDDIRVLELQIEEQRKILNDYGKPRGVWGGFAVLVYACIVGIIYPSMLLPYPTDTYNDNLTKYWLLILFFSQLVALFVYLGFAMFKLMKDES